RPGPRPRHGRAQLSPRKDPVELTHAQAENRLKDIADELERLAAKETLTDEDETYRQELVAEAETVYQPKVQLEREADRQKVLALAPGRTEADRSGNPTKIIVERADEDHIDRSLPGPRTRSGKFRDPWDLSEIRAGLSPEEYGAEVRARALDAIEQMRGTNDRRREVMTDLIERWDTEDGRIARLALGASDDTYLR